jgi:glycerol-3-phosphate dehydrogenase
MNRDPVALAAEQFDALIIGGGILGAGIARDAALRGLRVALIDKGDFAGATSSASSKLIHGGFRYLEQRAFRLVAESCRERAILQRIARHLVRPQTFLFPVYDRDRHSLLQIRAGAALYDWLARGRNVGAHQSISAARARMKEPALASTGLRGAVMIYDCQEDDARFCLDNVIHAAELGAICVNYCELTGFITREDRIVAARVRDRQSNDSFEIAARNFVNAAGPWAERVSELAPFSNAGVSLSPTKGIHLLLPKLTQQHALIFQARRDNRILFVLPWGDCSLVGTTDTDWRGDARNARAEADDIEYLLGEVNRLLPDHVVTKSDIITTTAGVRALLRSDFALPSQRSREHRIVRQGRNLIHVLGGKYTTHRLIAEQVVGQFSEAPCRTSDIPLPQHRPPPTGEKICDAPAVFASDIAHACEYEMARTVSDVMRRRTNLALSRHGGVDTAGIVARLMANHFQWNDQQMYASLQEYLHDRDCASRF